MDIVFIHFLSTPYHRTIMNEEAAVIQWISTVPLTYYCWEVSHNSVTFLNVPPSE